MPIVYRNTVERGEAKPRTQLFGHPNIMYLPSNTTGENLYDTVDRVVPCYANYSIVLTDGQVRMQKIYKLTAKDRTLNKTIFMNKV